MYRLTQSILTLLTLCVWGGTVFGQGSERWVFEGLITETDTALTQELQSGWILSGSFLLNTIQMQEQISEGDERSGRFVGGISEGELTVDQYYNVLFEATQESGLAGFDFQNNNLEEDGRDLLGWFFPLKGKLADTEWISAWLQIWLMDPDGNMINHLPVKISPYGMDWKSGWFRLTFKNESGESAHVDGRIENFSPESSVNEEENTQWYSVATDLSRQLFERDLTINLLEKELSDVQERMDGLRRMVDLLVEERSNLEEENEILREQAENADPAVIDKLASLTTDKFLLENQLEDLSGENESLQGKLNQSERDRVELLRKLQELESKLQKEEPEEIEQVRTDKVELIPMEFPIPILQQEDEQKVLLPEDEPVDSLPKTVEPQVNEPEVIEPVELKPEIQQTPVKSEQSKSNNKPRSLSRKGPRKFR